MATVPGARVVDGEIVDDETVVWAKVRGYPWWPATVKAACDPFGVKAKKDKKKSVQARFFGTDQLCGVKICDLKPFDPEAELLPGKVIDEKLAHAVAEAKAYLAAPYTAEPADAETAALLDSLGAYLAKYGGNRAMLDGWGAHPSSQRRDQDGVLRDITWVSPDGQQHRSKISVARHFKLNVVEPAARTAYVVPSIVEPRPVRRPNAVKTFEEEQAEDLPQWAKSEKRPPAKSGGGGTEGAKRGRGRPPTSNTRESHATHKFRAESAQHKEPLRNPDATLIETHGFAETPNLIPPALAERIQKLPMDEAEGISNAFQKNLEGDLLAETQREIGKSEAVADAIEGAFGVRRFQVKTVKVLMTEFCAEPQIPHADDFCNRELFGICHLLPEQPRTECVPYNHTARYPTNVSVECDKCGMWMPLPDRIARRRDHVDRFICADAGRVCGIVPPPTVPSMIRSYHKSVGDAAAADSSASPGSTAEALKNVNWQKIWKNNNNGAGPSHAYDEEEEELRPEVATAMAAAARSDPFACDVCEAFRDILDEPSQVIKSMRPIGLPPKRGDGIVALPTLVHRGPGGNENRGTDRSVLFFTIAPIFDGAKDDPEFDMSLGEYDAEAQIHAGWLLWRAGKVLGPEVPRVINLYDELGFNLSQFGKGEKLRYKSDGSHQEWLNGKGKEGTPAKKQKTGGNGKSKDKDRPFVPKSVKSQRALPQLTSTEQLPPAAPQPPAVNGGMSWWQNVLPEWGASGNNGSGAGSSTMSSTQQQVVAPMTSGTPLFGQW